MSFESGTVTEVLFQNHGNFTAFNTSASEGTLLSGQNYQPFIPAGFWSATGAFGRTIRIEAEGVCGSNATPTITFQLRLSTTAGSSTLTGTSVGLSAAITMTNSVTNKWWRLHHNITCRSPGGSASSSATVHCHGTVESMGAFATPFVYAMFPTAPDTATWTTTVDGAQTQFFNLSVTFSASHASNTIQCQHLRVMGLN